MKKNCWEVKKCGREPNGFKEKELGVCPAASLKIINTINGGVNGGRACWAVAGTLCGGKIQGTFASKLSNCIECDFYKEVWKEGNKDNTYVKTDVILKTIYYTKQKISK